MTPFDTALTRFLRPATLPATLGAAVAALSLALALGAARAEPVTFETAQGPMELEERPGTIAVYDAAAVDTLVALGHSPAGVPAPIYVPMVTEQLEGSEVVGTLFEPDFEALAAMRPDLVVVGLRSLAQMNALSRLAPVADMSIGPDAIADGLARLEAYGTLLGEEEKADALAAEVERKLAAAQEAVAANGGRALIVLTNGPKISTYGAGSRFGWLHDRLGWPEAADGIDAATHGEAISFEYIADVNPDTIIVVDRGTTVNQDAQSGLATLDNELVRSTTAWKEDRVLTLPTPELYVSGGGVLSIMKVLDAITASLAE